VNPRQLAQLAILVALPGAFASGAAPTLFHAPAERARITAERAAMLATEPAGGETQPIPAVTAANAGAMHAGPPRLEGVSLPREGRAHAWIGGRRYEDGALYQGQRVSVLRNGVQLTGANGQGRRYRVGEEVRSVARP
jgi:hypothetical protein